MANTGYIIITYIDVNPQSPSFKTTRTERVADSVHCGVDGSNWEVVSSYCELDSNYQNTGYYVTQEMDTNLDSPTYGETRDSKTYNTSQCPLQDTNPHWVMDVDEAYCETKKFASGVEGNTGRYIVSISDENIASSTYGQTQTSALTVNDWTSAMVQEYGEFPCKGVNTEPDVTPISESCVMVECSGKTTTNGQKKVFGIDKNLYSDTYLQSVETIVTDTDTCPNGCGSGSVDTYVFTFSDSSTTKTSNVAYSATQGTFTVTSTKNGSSQTFTASESCDWVTTSINGSTLTVNMTSNTGSSRSCTITLTQSGSNKTITLTMTQAAKQEDEYVFTWTGGYTMLVRDVNWQGVYQESREIISTKNGSDTEFTLGSNPCEWLTLSISGNVLYYTINANTDITDRRCDNIVLTQSGSNNKIYFTVIQESVSPQCSAYTETYYTVTSSSTNPSSVSYSATTSTLNWNYDKVTVNHYNDCSSSSTTESGSSSTTVTFSANTGTSAVTRSGSVTWDDHNDSSGNTISIPWSVSQSGNSPTYVFQFSDGTTAKQVDNTSFHSSAGTVTLLSTKNDSNINWSISGSSNIPEWLSLTTGSTSISWSMSMNRTTDYRYYNATLIQNESGKQITLMFSQDEYTGVTDGEIAFYNINTHEVLETTEMTNTTACVAGGPTTLWVWTNVDYSWSSWELSYTASSSMFDSENTPKMTTKNKNTARIEMYWNSNCSNSSNRNMNMTLETPTSQTILKYNVVQHYYRW